MIPDYAETLTVVVRVADQETALEPEYVAAVVARYDVGADGGKVDLTDAQPAVMEWQRDSGYAGWSFVKSSQEYGNFGASGASASLVVDLLTGVASGTAGALATSALQALLGRVKTGKQTELRPLERVIDADEAMHAAAVALDLRRRDLTLVAHDSASGRTVLDDRDGQRYEVRADRHIFPIKRLSDGGAGN
jgi:hypothetical protein